MSAANAADVPKLNATSATLPRPIFYVRRESAISQWNRPTRQLSLRPVAIGAVVEVTKRLKPSV
jgi:hypothetical protein